MIGFMISLIMVMVGTLITNLQELWDYYTYPTSMDRRELAAKRLALHEAAMKNGKVSPYTHPEEYTRQLW